MISMTDRATALRRIQIVAQNMLKPISTDEDTTQSLKDCRIMNSDGEIVEAYRDIVVKIGETQK